MNVFLWNVRARNGHVEATLNHPFPAQAARDESFREHASRLCGLALLAAASSVLLLGLAALGLVAAPHTLSVLLWCASTAARRRRDERSLCAKRKKEAATER